MTGKSHSPVLRTQNSGINVEVVAEVREAAFTHLVKSHGTGVSAIAEQMWIDTRLYKTELEMKEEHREFVVVKARIHQQAFQTLPA
jgi:hypothetical protein